MKSSYVIVSSFKDFVLTGSVDDKEMRIMFQLLIQYYYAPSAYTIAISILNININHKINELTIRRYLVNLEIVGRL